MMRVPTTQEEQQDINAAAAALPMGRNTLSSLSESREQWINKISNLVEGVLPKLPPWRMINHHVMITEDLGDSPGCWQVEE